MQYIPPFLSQIIDAVAFNGDPTDFRQDWLAWKSEYEQYFERESDYTVSNDDAQIVQNLPPLLEQLDAAVEKAFAGQSQADDLVQYAIDFFEAHDKFYEEREKQYFVQNPPLDRLLKVSVAYLQDRADLEALLKRAPDAALAVDAIQSLYLEAREELSKELVDGTVDGLTRAQKGFTILSDNDTALTREQVEEALFELRSAGELLEHVPALFRRFEEERGSPIPVMGPVLTVLREEDDEEAWEHLREDAWPSFVQLWESRQDGWLLEPELAYDLILEADQSIVRFSELLQDYPETEEDFWDNVFRMEDIFEQIRTSAMDLEALPSSTHWPEAQLLLNLLRGGAPLYAAHRLAGSMLQGGDEVPETIRALGRHLADFVRDPQPLPLLQGLRLLLDDLELSKTTRPCGSCGQRMPLEARQCPDCGAAVEELSISG
ncbi:MAG: hypothetical protein WC314_17385 [Vulcanimicrobiota bacterium]